VSLFFVQISSFPNTTTTARARKEGRAQSKATFATETKRERAIYTCEMESGRMNAENAPLLPSTSSSSESDASERTRSAFGKTRKNAIFGVLVALLLLSSLAVASHVGIVFGDGSGVLPSLGHEHDHHHHHHHHPLEWEPCDDDDATKDVELSHLSLRPNPVRAGKTATFKLQGNVLAKTIPETSVIDVQILRESKPLYTQNMSLCDYLLGGDEEGPTQSTKCPIERGADGTTMTFEYGAAFPFFAPSGDFEAKLIGKRSEESTAGDMFCAKVKFKVKGGLFGLF